MRDRINSVRIMVLFVTLGLGERIGNEKAPYTQAESPDQSESANRQRQGVNGKSGASQYSSDIGGCTNHIEDAKKQADCELETVHGNSFHE
jgi:hypothetical protein